MNDSYLYSPVYECDNLLRNFANARYRQCSRVLLEFLSSRLVASNLGAWKQSFCSKVLDSDCYFPCASVFYNEVPFLMCFWSRSCTCRWNWAETGFETESLFTFPSSISPICYWYAITSTDRTVRFSRRREHWYSTNEKTSGLNTKASM